MFSERDLIREIAQAAGLRPGVILGIGDDAAVIDATSPMVAAHDMLVEGVHFTRTTCSFADLGHKALAVNLSDLAAMGATPVAALVGLGLPADVGPDDVRTLYAAMEKLAERHGVTIAGGDVTSSPTTIIGVTALGRMRPGRAPVLRSGAQTGDVVCVTGALGGSAAGLRVLQNPALMSSRTAAPLRLRHRRPTPRVGAGTRLADGGATAMIDCSDGLVLDATRLAEASQRHIHIRLEAVPIDELVGDVAAVAGTPTDVFAATGGEDYELIVTLPADRVAPIQAALDLPLTVVGDCRAGPSGTVSLTRHGDPVTVASAGWEHGASR